MADSSQWIGSRVRTHCLNGVNGSAGISLYQLHQHDIIIIKGIVHSYLALTISFIVWYISSTSDLILVAAFLAKTEDSVGCVTETNKIDTIAMVTTLN